MPIPKVDPDRPPTRTKRLLTKFALSKAGTWYGVNVASRFDPALIRLTRGRVNLGANQLPTLLMTVRGRKSGVERTVPLVYFTDGDDVILIASRGGHRNHPSWYYNLTANPEVELWTKGGGGNYRATEAEGAERERLWELATEFNPGFAKYQERAGDRRIPVIVCSPQDD